LAKFFKTLYRLLVEKFGFFRVVLISGLTILILAVVVGNAVVTGVQSSLAAGLVSEAQREFEAGEYEKAALKLDEANRQFPAGSADASALERKIENAQLSTQAFASAKLEISAKRYLEAVRSLNKVQKDAYGIFLIAQKQLQEIRPKAERTALAKAKILAQKQGAGKGLALLEDARAVLGLTPNLKSSIDTYTKQVAAEKRALRASALSKLRVKKDSFTGLTWYHDKSSPYYRNSNAIYIYFGSQSGVSTPLRFVIQYFDDSWLFIESAKIKVDGKLYNLDSGNWERDNNSSIWEWFDEPLSDRTMIEEIIRSKSAIIRFEGSQYYDTRTITATQKRALKNVLSAFDNF
jgi:hypothetical protein